MQVFNAFQLYLHELTKEVNSLSGLDVKLFPPGGPQPKSLIEISGPPATGKSRLLQRFIVNSLLQGTKVLLIDLEHKLSAKHLTSQIRSALLECSNNDDLSTAEFEQKVESYLDSLTVLRCYTQDEFEYVLESLERLLWDHRDGALLAIDGLDAFYWYEAGAKKMPMQTHYADIMARIRKVCKQYRVVGAYTVNAKYLRGKKSSAEYKFQLRRNKNGGSIVRMINESPFYIDNCGIIQL